MEKTITQVGNRIKITEIQQSSIELSIQDVENQKKKFLEVKLRLLRDLKTVEEAILEYDGYIDKFKEYGILKEEATQE